jgi:hypothetical protein
MTVSLNRFRQHYRKSQRSVTNLSSVDAQKGCTGRCRCKKSALSCTLFL